MASISNIYTLIYNAAMEMRANASKEGSYSISGLECWMRLKSCLEPIQHIHATGFLPIEYVDIDLSNICNLCESNHFIQKLNSIHRTDEPTLCKILQISYNYGQLLGTDPLLAKEFHMFSELSNIVSFDDIQNMDLQLRCVTSSFIDCISRAFIHDQP
jgi:hypothetical protein